MTRHQHVDDHLEVAELLGDVPAQREPAFVDLPLRDVGPVEQIDAKTYGRALVTVAEHANDPADLRLLLGVLGLTERPPTPDLEEPAEPAEDPAPIAEPAKNPPALAGCVHPDPFVAWHPSGTAYAICEPCGTTWERQPCEACGSWVAALHIARSGRARHSNHPEPK